ncbi:hypothetical protein ACJEM7_25170, partial [Escherichia coli]
TLNKAGIWIAESLPYSVRGNSFSCFVRAFFAAVTAGIFYLAGQASWMPLYWQGFVIPFVFTISLFIIVRSLMAVTIKTAANVTFIRFFVLVT